ncbi:hypothetical protein [Hasllibacter sp. MH4015]|uniref:hypothetical protein n=1 Tax=Hasllibacter sp. MH4015 TaxID=2854029 RepID=UPI001CD1C5E7|nr:hypothetical protein [Hasllibacter sp. MH4015]
MDLSIWPATVHDKPTLARAYADYMAEIVPGQNPANSAPYFNDYWQEPTRRFPYLFGYDTPAGFAFVRDPEEPDLDFEMAEFCVYPGHRRTGLGTRVLPLIFDVHPGRWELCILRTNVAGLAFWPPALTKARVRDLRMREDETSRDYRFSVP